MVIGDCFLVHLRPFTFGFFLEINIYLVTTQKFFGFNLTVIRIESLTTIYEP